MNIKTFESYINVNSQLIETHTLEGLAHYMQRFMKTIPFEDINTQNQVPISTDVDVNFDKIVNRRRGGFCYELNTLNQYYLIKKGYDARILGATVNQQDGEWSFEDAHLTVYVKLEDEYYLVDVGFGESSVVPIPMNGEKIKDGQSGSYRVIRKDDNMYYMQKKKLSEDWVTQYKFHFIDRNIGYFKDMIYKNEHDSNSVFVNNLVISILTDNGRVTMTENNLTITENNQKKKMKVTQNNYRELTNEYFNINEKIKKLEG